MTQTFVFIIFVTCTLVSGHVHNAVDTEMFAIPISPNLFNWSYPDFDLQYRFHASLIGKPELPPWLRYIYSGRHHSGFIFGTPPRGTKQPITSAYGGQSCGSVHTEDSLVAASTRSSAGETLLDSIKQIMELEIIALNRQNYETRRVLLTLIVHPKENLARHEVELKIDNLNVEDLLDEQRMLSLKDILRTKLWIESGQDLYATFLASAIDLGARLPLKPSDGEGLVVRLGSTAPFSSELKRLREEVRPLSRLPSCPREYKRTTVERLFRDAGLTLDWCSFELYNTIYKERETVHLEYLTEIPNTSKVSKSKALDTRDIWSAPSRNALPSRSYGQQLIAAIAAPIVLMALSITALTAVVCFHYAALRDPDSEYFMENIFHICIDYKRRRAHRSGKVELCRYANGNTEQTQVADNISYRSTGVSPNNSLARPYSPKSTTNLTGNYNRPQPPPYISSATNTAYQRKSGADKPNPTVIGHTPEHARTLEESLKLLNEANINSEFENLVPILKQPIVDLNDGSEDYVPIKPDTIAYDAMTRELDDIDVPDLAKFGIGGVAGPI